MRCIFVNLIRGYPQSHIYQSQASQKNAILNGLIALLTFFYADKKEKSPRNTFEASQTSKTFWVNVDYFFGGSRICLRDDFSRNATS